MIPVHPVSDAAAYDELAWNLASRGAYEWNNGDVTAYWPVGTAFIYSLPYRLLGHDYAGAALLNLLAGTGVLALIIKLGSEWFTRPAALAAGALYAFWPSQIQFTTVLASELYFQLAVLSAMSAAFDARRAYLIRGLAVGALVAAAAYVRPLALPLVVLIPVAVALYRRVGVRDLLIFATAAAVTMAVCIFPWTMRNMRALGSPVIISTNGPLVMWMGNNRNATGEFVDLPADVAGMDEVTRSRVLGERARAFITEHPLRFSELLVRKTLITHSRETIGVVWNQEELEPRIGVRGVFIAKILSSLYWYGLLLLGLAGAALILRREKLRGLFHPALLAWAYFAAIHAVTLAQDRYHFPSIPFIAMLAGFAALSALDRFGWPISRLDGERCGAHVHTRGG